MNANMLLYLTSLALFAGLCFSSPALDAALGPQCTNPLLRHEWRTLTTDQKHEYIAAIKCLQSTPGINRKYWDGARTRYDDYVVNHINFTEYVHFTGIFQPWHRMFLAEYESDLRALCGYTGAQPYWDWTLDAGSFEDWVNSPIFDPNDGFGGNGPFIDSSKNDDVPARIPGKTGGGCVQDGPFGYEMYNISAGPGPLFEHNPRCLSRDFCPEWAIGKVNRTKADEPQSATTFAEFDRRVQGDLSLDGMMYHSGGHFGVGGEMGEMGNPYSSPNDPLFYLHHCNIDRLWVRWQAVDPTERTVDIAGPLVQFAPPFHFEPGHPLSSPPVYLDYPMPVRGLSGGESTVVVRTVMDPMRGRLCYAYDSLE